MADKKNNPEDSGSLWQNVSEWANRGASNFTAGGRTYKGASNDLRRNLADVGVPDNIADLVVRYTALANGEDPKHPFGGGNERKALAQQILDAVKSSMVADAGTLNASTMSGSGIVIKWSDYINAVSHFSPDSLFVSGMYPLPVPKEGATAVDKSRQDAGAIKEWVRQILPWKTKSNLLGDHGKKAAPQPGDRSMYGTLQAIQNNIDRLDVPTLSSPEDAVAALEPILKACYDAIQSNTLSDTLTKDIESRMQAMQQAIGSDESYAIRFVGTVLTHDYPWTLRWLRDCGLPSDRKSENALIAEYQHKGYDRLKQTAAQDNDKAVTDSLATGGKKK